MSLLGMWVVTRQFLFSFLLVTRSHLGNVRGYGLRVSGKGGVSLVVSSIGHEAIDRLIMRLKCHKLEQARVYSNDSMSSRWLLLAII
jgi:hypothetical protein